jgi:cyclohexyl-isocyanide hydratase
MVPLNRHIQVGSLLFEGLNQIDLTGPFEVLSRLPNSTYRIFAKTTEPMRDTRGLWLKPDATLADARQLDVLHVPGGFGQEAMMDDDAVLDWVKSQAAGALCVFSVCTGALICGAVGLLKGRRATTHWAAFQCCRSLARFRQTIASWWTGTWCSPQGSPQASMAPCGSLPSCAASRQLKPSSKYAPEPPFDSGTPETAPRAIHETARQAVKAVTEQREITARRMAARLGIKLPLATTKEAVEIRTRPNEE